MKKSQCNEEQIVATLKKREAAEDGEARQMGKAPGASQPRKSLGGEIVSPPRLNRDLHFVEGLQARVKVKSSGLAAPPDRPELRPLVNAPSPEEHQGEEIRPFRAFQIGFES